MVIKELINELKCYDDNMEVVMKPSNSMYVDRISGTETNELRAFYGKDRDVLILMSGGHEGAV